MYIIVAVQRISYFIHVDFQLKPLGGRHHQVALTETYQDC